MDENNNNEVMLESNEVAVAESEALEAINSESGLETLVGGAVGMGVGGLAGYRLGYAKGVTDVCKAENLDKKKTTLKIERLKHEGKKRSLFGKLMNKLGYEKVERVEPVEVVETKTEPEEKKS